MDDLQEGIKAYRAGKRDEARKFFVAAVKQNQNDERIWGWMYNVCDTDKERIHCLKQMLRVNPKNEKANQLLAEFTASDFPLERPATPQPKAAESQSATEQKPPSSLPAQTQKPVATQKPLDPKQQKNLQIGIVATVLLCVICLCVGVFFNNGNGGEKDYRTMAFIQCTLYVENMLKSPSSADFPASSTANIQELENKVFEVRSYVDSQNSFGAMIRTNFYCKIQYTGDPKGDEADTKNWSLLDLQFPQ